MKKIIIFSVVCLFSLFMIFSLSSCGEEENPNESEICLDGEHEFSTWEIEKEAVCNENGLRTRTCVICKQYTQKQPYKDSTKHNYVDNVCTYCGNSNAPKNVGFVLSDDETYYILYSVDDMDAVEYSIPAKYEGLPVRVIAANAFIECKALETVVVPNSVQTIEEGAFKGCYSLKKLTIPFVGMSRGEENAVFGYIFGKDDYAGSVGITQYPNGEGVDYWLPANLVDVTVTDGYLYEGCFENCTKIKRISYEGDADTVEDKAFNGCDSLTTVTLSDTVEKYGDRAFQNCSALDAFPLDGIEEIGEYCFAGCNISYLSTPSSLSYAGKGAFAACPSLSSVFISSSLRTVSNHMFQDCTALESVEFEEKVKNIGEASFSGCTKLTTVKIPSTIEEIEKLAFKECSALTSILIPSGVNEICEGTFQGCSSLKTVTIENGITTIGKYAFSACSSIVEIAIPKSVEKIGENAFLQCSSLKKILIDEDNGFFSDIDGNIYSSDKSRLLLYSPGNDQDSFVIPEGVTSIDSSAFENATLLKEVVFPASMKQIPDKLFYQGSTLKTIVINEGTEVIGNGAFAGCSALEKVTINGVLYIEEEAFTQCNMLKEVVIDGVESIGKGAFHSCPSLKSVSITNVGLIDENAFANSLSLTDLVFGKGSDITVGTEAFSNCTSLEELVITSSVKNLGEFAFSDCTNLKKVTMHGGITHIGEACFRNCSSLSEVSVSSTLSNVNAYAFEGCYSLEAFTVSQSNLYFKAVEGHLVDMNNNLIVFAPGQLDEEITIPEGIKSLGLFVFRNAQIVKRVNLPDSLVTIGNEAFYNSGIEEIDLKNVQTIGEFAFGKCLSLTEISIPKSVNEIKEYAFQDCIALKNVYIRNTLTTVGAALFHVTGTLMEELKLEEIPEVTVYIEFTNLPETWNEGWSAGGNVFFIMGHYYG